MKNNLIVVSVVTMMSVGSAAAVNFSLGVPPSATPAPGDDILVPGPGSIYVGGGGAGFDVNGFSYSHAAGVGFLGVAFSVDSVAVGAPGTAVFAESGGGGAPGEQSAGIYTSAFGGGNAHLHDGDGVVFGVPAVGVPAALGLIETAGAPAAPFDDLDGLDLRTSGAAAGPPPLGGTIYWTPSFAAAGPGASDAIFISAAGPGYAAAGAVWAAPGVLGLGTFGPGDDIDALVVLEDGVFGVSPGDMIYFSLAAGSPSLVGLGFAAGDILAVAPGGAPVVLAPAAALGLAAGDDLNALDLVVPEPGTGLLLAGGLIVLLAGRRRRY